MTMLPLQTRSVLVHVYNPSCMASAKGDTSVPCNFSSTFLPLPFACHRLKPLVTPVTNLLSPFLSPSSLRLPLGEHEPVSDIGPASNSLRAWTNNHVHHSGPRVTPCVRFFVFFLHFVRNRYTICPLLDCARPSLLVVLSLYFLSFPVQLSFARRILMSYYLSLHINGPRQASSKARQPWPTFPNPFSFTCY
jgi:hypothetical protein